MVFVVDGIQSGSDGSCRRLRAEWERRALLSALNQSRSGELCGGWSAESSVKLFGDVLSNDPASPQII